MTGHDAHTALAIFTREVTPLRKILESIPLHAALSCHILILLPLVSFPPLDVATLLLLGHATAAAEIAISLVLARLLPASQHGKILS
jgi:hypothetical protein